jgi:hypothetical protein
VYLLLRHHPYGAPASVLAGGILVVFEIVEYLVIGLTFFLQPLMFAIGLGLIGLGALGRTEGGRVGLGRW